VIPFLAAATFWPLAGTYVVEFETPGSSTWVVPQGIGQLVIEAWGGGGNYPSLNGNSGGGGGWVRATLAVTSGEELTVVVGAGGASGVGTNPGQASYVAKSGVNIGGGGGGGGRQGFIAGGGGLEIGPTATNGVQIGGGYSAVTGASSSENERGATATEGSIAGGTASAYHEGLAGKGGTSPGAGFAGRVVIIYTR